MFYFWHKDTINSVIKKKKNEIKVKTLTFIFGLKYQIV